MVIAPRVAAPRPFDPRNVSPRGLIHWARQQCPDLRVGWAIVDGERRGFARWTLGRDVYEREASTIDVLAQEVATVIARLLRIRTVADVRNRSELKRAIVEAEAAGETEQAEQLGRQLALRNAGAVPIRIPLRLTV